MQLNKIDWSDKQNSSWTILVIRPSFNKTQSKEMIYARYFRCFFTGAKKLTWPKYKSPKHFFVLQLFVHLLDRVRVSEYHILIALLICTYADLKFVISYFHLTSFNLCCNFWFFSFFEKQFNDKAYTNRYTMGQKSLWSQFFELNHIKIQ